MSVLDASHPKVQLIRKIQELVREQEEEEKRCAVAMVRDLADKKKAQAAIEASNSTRLLRQETDKIINLIHVHWPGGDKP